MPRKGEPYVFTRVAAIAFPLIAASANADEWSWAAETSSREDLRPQSPDSLINQCGKSDVNLERVAQKLVDRKVRDLSYLDSDGLTFAERVMGSPYVWPRAWIVSGKGMKPEETAAKLAAWRASFKDDGIRTCGVATGKMKDGTEVVAAIAVDAAAKLEPLPTRAHTGQWLTLKATMLVPASGARVVLLAPNESPRTIPSSYANGKIVARFAPNRPGAFNVQVLADLASGPRPVLEASVFADTEPPPFMPDLSAPGEDAAGAERGESALIKMVAALRKDQSLPPLQRNAALDKIARAHVEEMRKANKVAHDVGDGDPVARFEAAGIQAKESGENVANAQTIKLAHRALYASPSHRANLLKRDFTHIGIAVVEEGPNRVWACEVFAKF